MQYVYPIMKDRTDIILDSIADGVFTVDKEWRITSFNAAAERITGFEKGEAVGSYCHDVFRTNVCQTGCVLRRTLDTGENLINFPINILTRDGFEKPPAPLGNRESARRSRPEFDVIEGGPDLGRGRMAERLARLRDHHDEFRRSVILEPRGSDALVGALLCEPTRDDCAAGVLFFNNTGYLNILSFLIIFCIIFILVSVLGVIIKYILKIAFLGWVDRICGAGFGAVGLLSAIESTGKLGAGVVPATAKAVTTNPASPR